MKTSTPYGFEVNTEKTEHYSLVENLEKFANEPLPAWQLKVLRTYGCAELWTEDHPTLPDNVIQFPKKGR
jgi:hypothetical protein